VTLAPLTAPPGAGAPAPAPAAGPGQTFLRTSKPLPRTLRGQDGHASGFFNIFQTAGPEPDSTDILPTGVEMPDDAAGAAAAAADRRKAAESRESTPEGSMALSGSGAGGGGGVGRGGMLADDGEDSLAPLRAPPTGTGTGTTPAGSPSRGLSRTRSMKNAYGTGSVKLTARSTHGGGGGGVADDSYEGDGETPPTQVPYTCTCTPLIHCALVCWVEHYPRSSSLASPSLPSYPLTTPSPPPRFYRIALHFASPCLIALTAEAAGDVGVPALPRLGAPRVHAQIQPATLLTGVHAWVYAVCMLCSCVCCVYG